MATRYPPRANRKRGAKKRQMTFRCPEPPLSYLEKIEKKGHELTDVIVDHVMLAKDVGDPLDDVWPLIEYDANARGVSVGRMIGLLARSALRAIHKELSINEDPPAVFEDEAAKSVDEPTEPPKRKR